MERPTLNVIMPWPGWPRWIDGGRSRELALISLSPGPPSCTLLDPIMPSLPQWAAFSYKQCDLFMYWLRIDVIGHFVNVTRKATNRGSQSPCSSGWSWICDISTLAIHSTEIIDKECHYWFWGFLCSFPPCPQSTSHFITDEVQVPKNFPIFPEDIYLCLGFPLYIRSNSAASAILSIHLFHCVSVVGFACKWF